MKQPDLPSSAAVLAALISGSMLLLCLAILCYRRRLFLCKSCSRRKTNTNAAADSALREFLTMEDLLLQVSDSDDGLRLHNNNNNNNNSNDDSQQWTAESLVPNILKARPNKKRVDRNDDLTTPLL